MMGRFAALGFAVLLSACASTPTVNIDFDPAANFSRFRTYSWMARPDGAGSPLMQQRIVDGIDSRLQAKGWKLVPNGDVHVAAHVSTSERQSFNTTYTSVGYLGWGGFGPPAPNSSRTTVDTFEVGTLVVDMFDGSRKQAIWRGTASGTLDSDPARMTALLQAALDKMFAGFPPGSTPAK
ncbi:DUF4136 domain-containing protein [Variovorax sp. J2P1-59]|uniref:DUF4136 domain-containing protein n=1 Tax=Variovorax flavidus TaxID=3053501 RepID=UPI002575EA93|nr:DUF4136 domain-containing protein [Variovorax sp. J2P1-59]MDM0074700.1 DUF4136 domain-containing protein [Variovorax sp. J2P1-59]